MYLHMYLYKSHTVYYIICMIIMYHNVKYILYFWNYQMGWRPYNHPGKKSNSIWSLEKTSILQKEPLMYYSIELVRWTKHVMTTTMKWWNDVNSMILLNVTQPKFDCFQPEASNNLPSADDWDPRNWSLLGGANGDSILDPKIVSVVKQSCFTSNLQQMCLTPRLIKSIHPFNLFIPPVKAIKYRINNSGNHRPPQWDCHDCPGSRDPSTPRVEKKEVIWTKGCKGVPGESSATWQHVVFQCISLFSVFNVG